MAQFRVVFLSFLSVLAVIGASPVFAQAVEGCSPAVMTAMKAKAEAKVAYDVAVTEQVVDKPDSVLATTCFNKAATNSADKGGAIFSDIGAAGTPLLNGLRTVVQPSLDVMYENFEGAAGENVAGIVNYVGPVARAIGPAAGGTDCDGVKKLWEQIQNRGVAGGIPFVTTENLMAGTGFLGGGGTFGTDFESNWLASATTFTGLDTAMTSLAPTAVPAFTGTESSCQVLLRANVVTSCP